MHPVRKNVCEVVLKKMYVIDCVYWIVYKTMMMGSNGYQRNDNTEKQQFDHIAYIISCTLSIMIDLVAYVVRN